LNEAYRGISKATDVLSFVEDYLDPETGRMYLGDIVVSVETASRQAAEANHTLDVECTLLAIHGTLHLLGFDHAEPDEHDQMWKLQGEILQQAIEKYSGSSK
jgi:probable rRNA maturation factor